MLITDKLIYIELHKTGCTHTSKLLSAMYPGQYKIIGKHNTYHSVPKNILGDFDEKLKVGNIRNPWDWYVSLWSFGCQQKGGLYNRLTSNKPVNLLSKKGKIKWLKRRLGLSYKQLDPKLWEKLYSDPNNKEHFWHWLDLILSTNNHSLGEGYKKTKKSQFSGLLTHRYLKLYSHRKDFKNIDSAKKLVEYDRNENFMDHIIRNEHLEKDLIQLANKMNYDKDRLQEILNQNQQRTNKSNRKRDYRSYYNQESAELVAKYESYLIKKYDYNFE